MLERETLIVSESDIAAIIASIGIDQLMDDTIDALQAAFFEFGNGAIEIRQRTGFVYDAPEPGLVEFMPSMRTRQSVAMKVVGYHPGNPVNRQLPTILATNSLYDTTSGHLRALVDGTFATALRTGAASAVASSILAAPQSRVLGIIGTGAQAVTQAHALSRRFVFAQVLIHDTNGDHARSFADRTPFLHAPVSIVSKAEVLARADILVLATSNPVGAPPVLANGLHQPHLHINAIGSDIPGKTELSATLLQTAFVAPDYRIQALVEGECQQLSPDAIGPELHELVKAPERFWDQQQCFTVFDSTGNPLEDLVVTETLVRHAECLGIGRKITIEAGVYDPLDPYRFDAARAVARAS
ncbi:ornithine cyclodeaminase family protein [Jiella sp. MQZ9-1]|uniref:Ornithine cyclodeaminase family protein n=1 Tax=Jiella flava TaxID=2816857 RepID=A0A939JYM0_9HYPH|nr:ornithine cyclodeaminase family protein [Jiella flava]MBO0664551.1 ornithine cyclodeaminase family protein [Jiella flava]MCD2473172.1 ornithine cyclodeaminase family protein [Jiella flava]